MAMDYYYLLNLVNNRYKLSYSKRKKLEKDLKLFYFSIDNQYQSSKITNINTQLLRKYRNKTKLLLKRVFG